MFDAERILLAGTLLAYACAADWKTRRVSNRVWIAMGSLGVALTAIEWSQTPPILQPALLRQALVSIGFMYPFAWLLWRMHTIGGADAKALMALALTYPTYPHLAAGLPAGPVPPFEFFAFTLFGNSVILPLPALLWFLYLNRRYRNPFSPKSLVAVKMPLGDPRLQGQWRLLGDPAAGKGYKAGGTDMTPEYREKLAQVVGRDGRVWATYKIPFTLFITAGWAIAILYGDILYQLTRGLLGR